MLSIRWSAATTKGFFLLWVDAETPYVHDSVTKTLSAKVSPGTLRIRFKLKSFWGP